MPTLKVSRVKPANPGGHQGLNIGTKRLVRKGNSSKRGTSLNKQPTGEPTSSGKKKKSIANQGAR